MADFIRREDALFALQKAERGGSMTALTRLERAYAEIRGMPAADVAAVVHGRWISWEEADNPIPSPHWHECSVCHDAAQVLVNDIELLSGYCPNCGARMDGDAE